MTVPGIIGRFFVKIVHKGVTEKTSIFKEKY